MTLPERIRRTNGPRCSLNRERIIQEAAGLHGMPASWSVGWSSAGRPSSSWTPSVADGRSGHVYAFRSPVAEISPFELGTEPPGRQASSTHTRSRDEVTNTSFESCQVRASNAVGHRIAENDRDDGLTAAASGASMRGDASVLPVSPRQSARERST